MTYLLGIDFGGGASKATLIGADGRIVAEHTVEYPTLHPTPAACEQNPEDWIAALCENAKTVLKKAGIAPREIAAVAVDSAIPCKLVYKRKKAGFFARKTGFFCCRSITKIYRWQE